VSGHGVGAVAVKVLYVRPADLHELYGGCADKGCLPVVEQATVDALLARTRELREALCSGIESMEQLHRLGRLPAGENNKGLRDMRAALASRGGPQL
jgi:hypothetical protein